MMNEVWFDEPFWRNLRANVQREFALIPTIEQPINVRIGDDGAYYQHEPEDLSTPC